MLSPHFTKRELACRHCGDCKVDPQLVEALEQLRAIVGRPLIVTSAYRCEEHNKAVGGERSSYHVRGLAADVLVPKDMSLFDFYQAALLVPAFANGGIGVYPKERFLHLDVRGVKARWARVQGKYVGIEEGFKEAKT